MRALPLASAVYAYRPAVCLYKIAHNRGLQTQPAVPARSRAVGLLEEVEDERKEVEGDALTRVAHLDPRVREQPRDLDLELAARWVNLSAFDIRFQKTCALSELVTVCQ